MGSKELRDNGRDLEKEFDGEKQVMQRKVDSLSSENKELKNECENLRKRLQKATDERSTSTGRSLDFEANSTSSLRPSSASASSKPTRGRKTSKTPAAGTLTPENKENPVDLVQNALRSHEIREKSLERAKNEKVENKPNISNRRVWSSD